MKMFCKKMNNNCCDKSRCRLCCDIVMDHHQKNDYNHRFNDSTNALQEQTMQAAQAFFLPHLREMMLAACLIKGYYQPAGPLITHHPHPQMTIPPPSINPSGKISAPLPSLETTTPSSPQQPPAPSSVESSDNDVVITSATAPPPSAGFRYTSYTAPPNPPPPSYGSYYPQYYTSPPHYHDLCYPTSYPSYYHSKTYPSYHRRYGPPPSQFYPPDVYAQSGSNTQLVSNTTGSSGVPPTFQPEQPTGPIEPYPPYYPAYSAPPVINHPPCYSHSPSGRTYIDASYQSCPCPMQSCPKNVHTGPLTGDGKRSNMTVIAKETTPLPPVALALPQEPASVNGPPSPARGSAGMPPPSPSPAGATYQSTPKQEDVAPKPDQKKPARVGKNMVRNTIFRQTEMLLMCHSSEAVKREAISPENDPKVVTVEEVEADTTTHEEENNNIKEIVEENHEVKKSSYKDLIRKQPIEAQITNGKRSLKPKISLKRKEVEEEELSCKRICIDEEDRLSSIDRTIDCVIASSIEEDPCIDRTIDSVIASCIEEKEPVIEEEVVKEKEVEEEEKPEVKSTKPVRRKSKSFAKWKTRNKRKGKVVAPVEILEVPKVPRKMSVVPRWSNGWEWEGTPYQARVFLNSDDTVVTRTCYPAMRHIEGDIIQPRDCVLLKSGQRKGDLPFVAKIASLWENPEDGEMMMSLLWFYRPEHTEQGRLPTDHPSEVFASRHKDTNSVACIEDKCYVLTFFEYCRYYKSIRSSDDEFAQPENIVPRPEVYPRSNRLPPSTQTTSPDLILFCSRVYDFRQKRLVKNPN